jgi:outer membrane protein assembly factor BamE (lipoprotein component of BamABCDE complex)
MNSRTWCIAVSFAALALTGCAGSDFVRPAESDFVVGKSTLADVNTKMGNPLQTGQLTKNDKLMKVSKYAYAASGGESAHPGVTPARSLTFLFFEDNLVGKEFVSSFKQDSTDFDGQKVSSISKGKSTRQDVVALLGKPSGEAVYPVIKNVGDAAYVYSYVQAKGTVFNMKFYNKSLLVSFSPSGLVTDVEYTTSGEQ